MKLTTQTTAIKESTVDVKEHFSLQDGMPCIDFVVGGYLVARQVSHQQPVGQAFRLINKLYVPDEPMEYKTGAEVDVSGIAPDVTTPKPFIGVVVPQVANKKTKQDA
ncbi:hypothetical protein D0962_04320 [Leptolyngbyaceae cyanobacterium CCMR0082]|uniref:Uncharacterized protein n=1 Tax=Adonisia turfae CCMR0082 TaxID=2304604 RepID=A0A6M0S0T7_9CYAN|nr:hypothetical protein [Adonisia turfae]NEZ62006.1 hypothetical protein [Adonisia turfae CCMR0082]